MGNTAADAIAALIEQEAHFFNAAEERIGLPIVIARDATLLLSGFMASVSASRHVFIRCMALQKKHHTLAFLSVARRQHVQAMMNLRQVVEAISNSAFALGNPDASYVDDSTGLVMSSTASNLRAYKWIKNNFPMHSGDLKYLKDWVNNTSAHFNIAQSSRNVSDFPIEGFWKTDLFDAPDEYLESMDLWLLTLTALCSMHLTIEVGRVYGGFDLAVDTEMRATKIQSGADAVRDRLKSNPRFAAAMASANAMGSTK